MQALTMIEIPLKNVDDVLQVDVNELPSNPDEILQILVAEEADAKYYLQIAVAYYHRHQFYAFVEIVERALTVSSATRSEKLALLNALASYYIARNSVSSAAPVVLDVHFLTDPDAGQDFDAQKAELKETFLNKAAFCLNQAIALDQEHRTTFINRGFLFLARNDLKQAEDSFDNVLKSRPTHIVALLGKGQILMKRTNWREALKTFQILLRLTSQSTGELSIPQHLQGSIRSTIGDCLYNLGFTDRAIYAFKRALAVDPDNVNGFVGLATALLQKRNSGVEHEGKGRDAQVRTEDDDSPIELLKRAYQIITSRRNKYKKTIEIEVLRREQLSKQKDEDELMTDGAPDFAPMLHVCHPVLTLRLAEQFLAKNDLASARSMIDITMRSLNEHDEENKHVLGDTYYAFGYLMHASNKIDGAVAAYSNALKFRENLLKAEFGLAQVKLARNDTEPALELLEGIRRKLKDEYLKRQHRIPKTNFYNPTSIDYEDFDTIRLLTHAYAVSCNYGIPDLTAATSTKHYEQLSAVKKDHIAKLHQAMKILIDLLKGEKLQPDYAEKNLDVLLLNSRILAPKKLEESVKPLETIVQQFSDGLGGPEGSADPEHSHLAQRNKIELFNNLGALYHMRKCFDKAAEWYGKALEVIEQARHDENVRSELKLDENSLQAIGVTVMYNKARLLENMELTEEAEALYRAILERNPSHPDCLLRMVNMAIRYGQYQLAESQLLQIIKLHNKNLEARTALGNLYESLGQTKMSRRTFEEVLQKVSKYDLVSLLKLGNLYLDIAHERSDYAYREGQYKRAFEFFDKVLRLDPSNAYAASGLARTFAERRLLDDARNFFTQVRESSVNNPLFVVNLAHVTLELGHTQNAIALYEFASKKITATPGQHQYLPCLYVCTARAHYIQAKATKSLHLMRRCLSYVSKALKLQPQDEGLWFDLALTQQQFAQIVHDMPSEKRSSELVNRAIQFIDSAREIFLKLGSRDASHKQRQSSITQPYDPRMAQQRERHGEVIKTKLLRRKQEQDAVEEERQRRLQEMQARRQADEEERQRREREAEEKRRRREEEITRQRNQLQEQLMAEFAQSERAPALDEYNTRKSRRPENVDNSDEDARTTKRRRVKHADEFTDESDGCHGAKERPAVSRRQTRTRSWGDDGAMNASSAEQDADGSADTS